LLSALYTCHVTAKTIHMDIKPENIMLNSDKDFILVDFGSSTTFEGDDDEIKGRVRNAGSVAYKAPECHRIKGPYHDKTKSEGE
jgi:serine/threonine protein kinase